MRSAYQYIAIAVLVVLSGVTVAEQPTDSVNSNVASTVSSDGKVNVGAKSQTDAKRAPDIRTIIDISGSMKKTDPNNLRAPAMRLLVDLLPEDSKSGVWTFGQYVNMLVKHRVIDDAWKEEAKNKSNDVSSVGLFTNIGDAINTAGYDLDRLKPEYEPFFILLTDGMVDVDKDPEINKKEQDRILKELVPKFADAGVKLHTIALSDKADQDFLQQLSLSTGGMSTVAENSDELLKAFVRLFDQSVPSEEVPLQDNKFLIDSSIEEFTALIFRKEGSEKTQLISPDESIINADSQDPDVTWHTDANYDLITVKRPYEGEWSLQAEADPDNRVTVVSDLTLQLEDIPPTIFSGEEINVHAWFDSEEGQVKDSEFLSLLDGALQLTNEAGKSIKKEIAVQQEGEYQHSFFEKIRNLRRPGEFEISVLVDGKTFKRQRSHRIEVLEPFAYDVRYDGVGEESVGIVTATPLLSGLDLEKTKVIAQVKAPDDSSLIASAEMMLNQDGQQWVVQVTPSKGEGIYRVALDLRLFLETGKEFRLKPKPFDLKLPYFPEGYIASVSEPDVEKAIKPVIEEPKMSLPEETTTAAEVMPEAEPKPEEPEEDNLFTWIMLGVLSLVAGILGVLFYKLRSHKKVQDEIGQEESDEPLDEDMAELSQLDTGELNEAVEEAPELSEQVDAVREELERMGGALDEEDTSSVSDDDVPDLDQDELVSALDELSGNQTEMDADDMMDDSPEAPQVDDAFAPVDEEPLIEDEIDKELDALLEETDVDSDLNEMMEDSADIPTLDEPTEEAGDEPELEIDFDAEVAEEAIETPDDNLSLDETVNEDDASDVDPAQQAMDDIDSLLEEEIATDTEESIDDLMEEVAEAQDASELSEKVENDEASAEVEAPIDDLAELLEDTPIIDEELEADLLADDDGELVGGDEENSLDSDMDDFGDSIDQALDELLAESNDAENETTEEFNIDDLEDMDSELDALTKDLEAGVLEESSESSASVDDELESLLGDLDADESLKGELDAFDQLDQEDGTPLDDSLTALEDISAEELDAPDDGEVDIDKIMAEIDAEAMQQNQKDKDS